MERRKFCSARNTCGAGNLFVSVDEKKKKSFFAFLLYFVLSAIILIRLFRRDGLYQVPIVS